jgi:hypothetical protein
LRQARILNPNPIFDNNRRPQITGGAWTQVSRLSAPLVNEVIIGLKDKDRFNASQPRDDAQFATYVTNPTLPELLEILFKGVAVAPNLFPRTDLVAAFLTGVQGLNQPASRGDDAIEHQHRRETCSQSADVGRARGRHVGLPQRPSSRR